jgi:hypothetical protein
MLGQPAQRGLHQRRGRLDPVVVLALPQQPREQVPDLLRRGAQPVPLVVIAQQHLRHGQAASSASVTSGGLPGPCRVKPRAGMIWSVSST